MTLAAVLIPAGKASFPAINPERGFPAPDGTAVEVIGGRREAAKPCREEFPVNPAGLTPFEVTAHA